MCSTKRMRFWSNFVQSFPNKFAAKLWKRFSPHLNNVSTLPCEIRNAHRAYITTEPCLTPYSSLKNCEKYESHLTQEWQLTTSFLTETVTLPVAIASLAYLTMQNYWPYQRLWRQSTIFVGYITKTFWSLFFGHTVHCNDHRAYSLANTITGLMNATGPFKWQQNLLSKFVPFFEIMAI